MPYRPNALDSATVRQIRIAHLIDGESCKSITRRTGVSVACVSRLCRWLSQSESDQDLRYLPRPIHRGGGSRAGTEAYEQERPTHYLLLVNHAANASTLPTMEPAASGFPNA